MPTFTYQIEYRGHTKSVRIRKSNPKGWIGQVVQEAFPGFEVTEPILFGKITRAQLAPDKTHAGKWRLQCNDEGSGFSLSVVETKGR